MAPFRQVDVVTPANTHSDTCVRIDYRPHLNIDSVATLCLNAWLLKPDWADVGDVESSSTTALQPLFYKVREASKEDLEAAQNPDRETVHTPLRDGIYFTWNHVFYDVSREFNLNCAHASYKPPAHNVIELRYPETVGEGKAVRVAELELDCNVLIAPAFLNPGATVWVLVGSEQQSEIAVADIANDPRPTCAFDASNPDVPYRSGALCWIRSGQRLQFFVSGQKQSGLAGVLVYGKFTMDEETT